MAKVKISKKRKKSSLNSLREHDVFSGVKDPKIVKQVLVDALMENDLDTFKDVLIAYLRSNSKTKLAAKTGLGRQTLYDLIDDSKPFNPTFETLGTILEKLAA
jgi:DNA-binding phage protein